MIGNTMAAVAIPWFVLQETGSASQTGFTGMAAALPMAMSGVFGGPLVDRLGGRKMSIISDVISALAVLAIPILHMLDLLTYPLILVLVFLGAMLDIPGVTARRMLLPGFQKQAELRAEQMNSAFEVLNNASSMVGPVVAGALIAFIGPVNVLWLTVGGFLASAAGVYFFAPPNPQDRHTQRQPYLESMKEGFRFIGQTPVLLAMALLFGISNFVSNGFWGVGLQVFAYETWDTATRLGVLISAVGVGTLSGAMLYGVMGHRWLKHRREILLIGFSTQWLWLSAFLFTTSLPVLLLAMFLVGFSAGPANPMSVTIRFEHIPVVLRGRVFATFSAITAAITPVGIAAAGLIIEHYGIHTGITCLVVAYALLGLALPFVPAFHDMNHQGPYVEGKSAAQD
ncbi:MAG: MFS transporter [Thermomicrobiales bacterium]|nr:MFS transporter [Thermomicrobiales bacterium]